MRKHDEQVREKEMHGGAIIFNNNDDGVGKERREMRASKKSLDGRIRDTWRLRLASSKHGEDLG